ncbi:hypothetical protein C0J52_00873 [Blattella germanica]|nr:hypothetical protein C0J52_00873 [Blattella germanica]
MEEGSVAKVLNDFLTVTDGEISLKKGDVAQVLEKVDRHWWYGCCGGKYGKFPASYLIAVDVPFLEDGQELFAAIENFPRQQDGDLSFSREHSYANRPHPDGFVTGVLCQQEVKQ